MSNQEIIHLDGQEAALLLSRIKNEEMGFQELVTDQQAVPLLLRLFMVFNQLIDEKGIKEGEVAIAVSEQEAWILRKSVMPTDAGPNGRPLGILLMRKIHQVLLAYRLPKLQVGKILKVETEEEATNRIERQVEQWIHQLQRRPLLP